MGKGTQHPAPIISQIFYDLGQDISLGDVTDMLDKVDPQIIASVLDKRFDPQ